jgi:hypothetical protein
MLPPSPTLIFVWEIAASEAAALRNAYIEPEHFFIGLCRLDDFSFASRLSEIGYEASIAEAMQPEIHGLLGKLYRFGVNPHLLRREIREGKGTGMLRRLSGWTTGSLARSAAPPTDGIMHRSVASREVFDRATEFAQAAHASAITTNHLLAALLEYTSGNFTALLRHHEVNINGLRDAVLTMV